MWDDANVAAILFVAYIVVYWIGILLGWRTYNNEIKERLKKLQYPVTIDVDEDGGGYEEFYVSIENLPGTFADGKTLLKALSNLKDVQQTWVDLADERGLKYPKPGEVTSKIVLNKELLDKMREKGITVKKLMKKIREYVLSDTQMQDSSPIRIYEPENLPEEVWNYIDNRDDIDYVALVSKQHYNPKNLPAILDNDIFGCCSREVIDIPEKDWFLYIGYHS